MNSLLHLHSHPTARAWRRLISTALCALLINTLLSPARAPADDYSHCFVPGERAYYKVKWSGIPVAWSQTTTEEIEEEGQTLIRLRMESQTYSAYNHLYRVHNIYETILNPKTALPIRSDIRMNERGQHKNHLTTFDHQKGIALFMDRENNDIKEIPITPQTRDMLSFIFFSRHPDFNDLIGPTYQILVDGKIRPLQFKSEQKPKSFKIPAFGKVESIPLEPIAEFDGLFLRQGRITFWVSTQKHRIITCTEAKVTIGKITIKLDEFESPAAAFHLPSTKD
jgi:hypothetical protein